MGGLFVRSRIHGEWGEKATQMIRRRKSEQVPYLLEENMGCMAEPKDIYLTVRRPFPKR